MSIPTFASGAMERLEAYNWPGNVRDLENAIERALIMSKGEPLSFSDFLKVPTRSNESEKDSFLDMEDSDSLKMDVQASRHINRILKMTKGNVGGKNGAARLLGLHPNTLRHRMQSLGIPFGRKAKALYKTKGVL